jgi:hypothetical protein
LEQCALIWLLCNTSGDPIPYIRMSGIILITAGITLIVYSFINWTTLKTGIRPETKDKVTIQESGSTAKLHKSHIDNVTIIHRWSNVDKDCEKDINSCSPVGWYQVSTENNTIRLFDFSCNIPVPDMLKGTKLLTLNYIDKSEDKDAKCKEYFESAVVKEP